MTLVNISEEDLNILYSHFDNIEEALINRVEWLVDNICSQEGHNPKLLTKGQKYKIVKKTRNFKNGQRKKSKIREELKKIEAKKKAEKEKKEKESRDKLPWRLK